MNHINAAERRKTAAEYEGEAEKIRIVAKAKAEAEDAKIGVRNARQEANKEIRGLEVSEDLQKNAEGDVQALTDKYIRKIDAFLEAKEVEIMKV